MDLNKILLVDNKNDTSYLKTQLTNEKICDNIITTDNGTEAIELLANKDIDLVITNLTVKNVDGIGIMEKARALELETKFINNIMDVNESTKYGKKNDIVRKNIK